MDFDSDWTQVKEYSSDSYSWEVSQLCMNMPSAKITKRGAGEFRQQTTAKLFSSGNYTLSAFIKTTGLTGGHGAYLKVISNGQTYTSEAVSGSTAGNNTGSGAEGWQRLNVTFPFEYGTDTSVTVQLASDAVSGILYWSCPQLEEGSIVNHFNMVANSDFSETVLNRSRPFPAGWTKIGSGIGTSTVYGVISDRSVNHMPSEISGNAMRLESAPNGGDRYIAYENRSRGEVGDVYVAGGWCNVLSIAQGGVTNFEPAIAVRFLNRNNATWTNWQYVKFSTRRSGWQYACGTVVSTVQYARIQVAIYYSSNNNTAMFSHVMLNRDRYGNSFTYDANGNVTPVKDLTNQQSAAQYDGFDNLLSYIQPGSAATEKYLFTYGDTDTEKKRHLPRTAVTPCGVKTATEYDSYGNAISSTIQPDETSQFIRTDTGYTSDGNYVQTQTDARGNTVTNAVDANGKVLSVTDPDNNQVGYQYDASNRVTEVIAQNNGTAVRNAYTYENDRIKTVAHNTTGDSCDVLYTFNYDALGRKTSVTVSNGSEGATEQPLSTNIYSTDRKGRLEEVQYGNGGKVAYEYDDFDRVTGIKHDAATEPRFTTEYDAQGRVAKVTDTADGNTIRSQYDLTDRPTESEQRDGNGNLKYRTQITYDVKSRVSSFTETTENGTHKTDYTYDADNRVTQIRYNGSDDTKVDYTYDSLNRITNRTVINEVPYSTAYAYVPGSTTNSTTPLIQSITQGSGANAINFSYTYDNRGNITSETRNGVTTTYEYDAIGQLTRVNDPNDSTGSSFGTTWIYSYDCGGNILNKTAYVYTTGTVGTAVRNWAYGYNDPSWKDKLTSFDGHTITYDAIGNPLNDGEWTYEWQAGRQLKRMSKTEKGNIITMEFGYNHAGLRTKKVRKVNNVVVETTEYILNGKNVVGLLHTNHTTNSVNKLHFQYDVQGRATLINFNGIQYSYAYNLQGDIIGIINENGELVAEYKYDAWGKPVGATGGMTGALASLNPFRYRQYIWNNETETYELWTRGYNPIRGRFISCDSIETINRFNYAENNPLMYIDRNGKEAEQNDCTSMVMQAINNNISEFEGHRISVKLLSSDVLYSLIFEQDNYIWFMKQVNHNAKWDLKNPTSWYEMFNEEIKDSYTFRGEKVTPENIGNITYGYLGTAMGIPAEYLYIGGGIAKKLNPQTASKWDVLWAAVECVFAPYYGDDENDHVFIETGINYYWEDHS